MGDFFGQRKEAVRQVFTREPNTASRALAVPQILASLTGAALILLAPDPNFGPLILLFVCAIVGLSLMGSAEFVPGSAAIYRASLRVLGFVLLTPPMVAAVVVALGQIVG